jgi:hypothetical protein
MKDDLGNIRSITIKNNIAFGAFVSPMSNNTSLLKNNSNGLTKLVLIDNIDIPPGQKIPAGIVDSNYYRIESGAQTPKAPIIQTVQAIYSDGSIKTI